MSEVQRSLPGFENLMPSEFSRSFLLLYAAHVALRMELAEGFEHEVGTLREMGKLNSAQCPDRWYIAQRNICMSIQGLVKQLDELNDEIGEKFHAK